MTTYLGLDVLERRSNAREDPQDSFTRSLAILDPGMGKRGARARDAAPAVDRSFLWTCHGPAEIRALKEWFAVRQGQRVPVWLPTGRQDLRLAQAAGAIDASILIQPCGYTRYAYPQAARQHLAIRFPDGAQTYRRVLEAVDNGTLESLTLSSALGQDLPADAWVSYLVYCRLASDSLELAYLTNTIAEARLRFVEIPLEAP